MLHDATKIATVTPFQPRWRQKSYLSSKSVPRPGKSIKKIAGPWCYFTNDWKVILFGSWFWVNYNISLTWIKAIWGWFPLLTMIPVRENSEVVIIYPDGWLVHGKTWENMGKLKYAASFRKPVECSATLRTHSHSSLTIFMPTTIKSRRTLKTNHWIGLLGKILTGNPWVFTCFYHQIDRAFRCKFSHHPILWTIRKVMLKACPVDQMLAQ